MRAADWIAVIGAVATLITAITGFIVSIRKINAVHVLVNAQLMAVMTKLSESVAREAELKEEQHKQDLLPRRDPG